MIAEAHIVQAKRRKTRPSRAAKAKRVDSKKQRGAVKQGRGKVSFD
jgi:ribosome-associated protein